MINCPACGKSIGDDDRFCGYCKEPMFQKEADEVEEAGVPMPYGCYLSWVASGVEHWPLRLPI
jgi:hypothetical protein